MSKLKERRKEIHAMDLAAAQAELAQLRRTLFDLRMQLKRGEVRNNRQFMQHRADIARLVHHISEIHNAEALEAQGALPTEER